MRWIGVWNDRWNGNCILTANIMWKTDDIMRNELRTETNDTNHKKWINIYNNHYYIYNQWLVSLLCVNYYSLLIKYILKCV